MLEWISSLSIRNDRNSFCRSPFVLTKWDGTYIYVYVHTSLVCALQASYVAVRMMHKNPSKKWYTKSKSTLFSSILFLLYLLLLLRFDFQLFLYNSCIFFLPQALFLAPTRESNSSRRILLFSSLPHNTPTLAQIITAEVLYLILKPK